MGGWVVRWADVYSKALSFKKFLIRMNEMNERG